MTLVNRVNKERGFKPWGFSKSSWFHVLVVIHNVGLAIYSGWTFYGFITGLGRSLNWEQGLTGLIDSNCKIHGNQGFGNASFYSTTTTTTTSTFSRQHWMTPEQHTHLITPSHPPSSLIPGRLWNESLAFYGFIFYLSKFYEVVDTMIILAKGKKSSLLQTYHHAGAMICMWAGIRYMSPPIWMFVCVNSFIHALMYTYYTLTALSIHIPKSIKQSLTTLQIMQFLFGGSFAFINLFISYSSPTVFKTITEDGKNQLVFGEREVTCIGTSGEAFAVLLNVAYLLPLTWLFARFFVKSYLGSGKGNGKGKMSNGNGNGNGNGLVNGNGNGNGKVDKHSVEKALGDARKGLDRETRDL